MTNTYCCLANVEWGNNQHDGDCEKSRYRLSMLGMEGLGIGTVRFHRLDGAVVTLEKVQFDSISNVGANRGVVSGDFENGDLFHVPFVAWWEVVYE